MDLKSYLAIIRGQVWVIVTTFVVTLVAVTAVTFLLTPTYAATTTLRVATASSGVVTGYSDYMYADRLMNTYTKLATTKPVMDELRARLNIQQRPYINVVIVPNTELIKITVESTDPTLAQNSANTLAEILISLGKELYTGSGKSTQEILAEQLSLAETELNQTYQQRDALLAETPQDNDRIDALNTSIQLKEQAYATLLEQYDEARLREAIRANIISVVEPAAFPIYPIKPKKTLNLGLGAIVGLVGGLGLAFLLENFGTRLYTTRQIEAATSLSPIGKIPAMSRNRLTGRKGEGTSTHTPFREAFRRLGVHLLMVNRPNQDGTPLKTILLTSAEPGEGKSTITANLAIAMAQAGKKVIVVDCDLHKPKQHRILGLSNGIGLSLVLSQQVKLEKAIQATPYPGFSVLTTGPLPANPVKMLTGPQFKSLLQWLTQQYDLVLLDSPAFLAVTDTAVLTPLADGVLLVARRNYVREEAVQETCGQLTDLNARLLGLVINDAEKHANSYYYKDR